jgi:hypothetical protein
MCPVCDGQPSSRLVRHGGRGGRGVLHLVFKNSRIVHVSRYNEAGPRSARMGGLFADPRSDAGQACDEGKCSGCASSTLPNFAAQPTGWRPDGGSQHSPSELTVRRP